MTAIDPSQLLQVVLAAGPEGVSCKSLAALFSVTRGAIKHHLKKMKADGLVVYSHRDINTLGTWGKPGVLVVKVRKSPKRGVPHGDGDEMANQPRHVRVPAGVKLPLNTTGDASVWGYAQRVKQDWTPRRGPGGRFLARET